MSVFEAIISAPMTILFLGIAFILMVPFAEVAFNAIDAGTTAGTISYGATIKTIIQLFGVIITILGLLAIYNEFRTREQYAG